MGACVLSVAWLDCVADADPRVNAQVGAAALPNDVSTLSGSPAGVPCRMQEEPAPPKACTAVECFQDCSGGA